MLPSFDLIAGITVAGILVILAVYIVIVYKKGWLKKESRTDQQYYLCPNQKCKRVFKKPVWLTDLSTTPPESYQACPHCGINIQATASPRLAASDTAQAAPKPPHFSDEVQSPQTGPRFVKSETTSSKTELSKEPPKPVLHAHAAETSPLHEVRQAHKSIFHFPQIRKDKPQKPLDESEKSFGRSSLESSRKCSHFFGYVKTLPKNTPIPDECLWCPSIVDCLSHETRVEAEA